MREAERQIDGVGSTDKARATPRSRETVKDHCIIKTMHGVQTRTLTMISGTGPCKNPNYFDADRILIKINE